jgi:ketosteroid isomerase-like protein
MMSRNLVFALLTVATVMSAGCAGNRASSVDTATMEAQIRQADLALLRAETQRDLDGVMELIAPGAVFQPPGYPPIVGREAIRQFYDTEWFKLPFIEISGRPESIVVGSSGNMAYLDGRSEMVLEVSGERTVAVGKYLGVWRRISGQWKLAAISWSGNEVTR